MTDNPLLAEFTAPNGAPPFDRISTEHYLPAIKTAINEARAHIEAVKSNPDTPSFDNTILSLETASETLGSVSSIYYNQLSASGGDDLHALMDEIGPIQAAFASDINLDPDIFARVKAVYDEREALDLTAEQHTLLEDSYKGFVRSGALLPDDKKERLREISQELSTLSPAFMQNVSKSAEAFELHITDKDDLAGLPDNAIQTAAETAKGVIRMAMSLPSITQASAHSCSSLIIAPCANISGVPFPTAPLKMIMITVKTSPKS